MVPIKAQFRRRASELSSTKARQKLGTQLISTSSAVLHKSGTAAIQTSCLCRAKQNSEITLMYFGGIAFSRVELLRGFRKS